MNGDSGHDYTIQEFARSIKEKYPDDYGQVPDYELAAAVLTKFPEYRTRVRGFDVPGAEKLTGMSVPMLQHYLTLYDQFQQAGIQPIIRAGVRTAEQENALYRAGYPTKGNDGYNKISPHQEGRAMDVSFAPDQKARGQQIMAAYAKANGLHIPSDEPWHIAVFRTPGESSAAQSPVGFPNPAANFARSSVYGFDESETGQPPVPASPEGPAAQVAGMQKQQQASLPNITPYDLEWHLGIPATEAVDWFANLPKAKAAQVYQAVARGVAEDERKKAAGVALAVGPDYQASMRKRLGITSVPVPSVVRRVPQEPSPLTLPQVGGGAAPSMASIVSQARQQGDTRTPEQINDSHLMEQAVKNVSSLSGSLSPAANVKSIYRVLTQGRESGFETDVQEEFQRLKEQQARANTPEMIAAQKRIGAVPESNFGMGGPSPRGLASTLQRSIGEGLKAAAGIADPSTLSDPAGIKTLLQTVGVPLDQARDYLNARGNVLVESASAPLNAQGEAIERTLPEKATDAVASLGISLAQLILLKKATGLNLGPLMAIESTLKNSDRPLKERIPDAAEAYVMGKVLDQHLSRPLSAIAFGAPTAVSTGLAYSQGKMKLEDVFIQTIPQAIMGAALGGKPKSPLEATTFTKVPEFPEEVAGVPPHLSEFVKRQNDFYQNRISTAEAIGDTERANQLRQQWASVQERLGKMQTRAVPPEPQTGLTPELEARVNRAMENERLRNQPAAVQSEPMPEPARPDPRFAGISDEDLLSRVETLQQRPKKGTSKAKRDAMGDELQAAQVEMRRRFSARGEGAPPPSAEDIPSFKEFVENHPRAGGVRLESLDVDDPLFEERAREYIQLYGGKENAISQGQIESSGETELRGVREGQNLPAYGGEVRQEAGRRPAGGRSAEGGGQVQEGSLIGKRIRSGSVVGTVIEETPSKVRVRSDRGGEMSVPKGPNIQVLRSVPKEPVSTQPAGRPNEPLLTSTEVPPKPAAAVSSQSPSVSAAQPVPVAETTASIPERRGPNRLTDEQYLAALADARANAQPRDIPYDRENDIKYLESLLKSGEKKPLPFDQEEQIRERLAKLRAQRDIEAQVSQPVAETQTPPQPANKAPVAVTEPTPAAVQPKPEQIVSHSNPELDGAKVIGKVGSGKKLKVEKKDGTRAVIQNPRGEMGNQQAAIRTSVPIEPLRPIPILSGGGEAEATTERGTTVNTRYAIVEAKDLVTSHDKFQNENPRFPSELQPRDRSRVASAAQINDIAKNPRPAELADNAKAAHGSPIISDDGVVEVGNGRSIALNQMYETGGEPAGRYRQFLADNAERLGLDKSAVDKAKEPVLVRIRTTELSPEDRIRFVNEANEQGGARMSAPEQAIADAKGISGSLLSLFRPSDSGEINTAANHGFIQAFMRDVVGPADLGEYVDARGAISQAGIARIRNAIFARAYADSPQGLIALEKLAESPDNNVRNITTALLQNAGGFSNLKEGIVDGTRYYTLDITGDLTKALTKMSALREQRQTVGDYLDQQELFESELTPLQRRVLQVLDANKRSGKAISEILGNYLRSTEAAGDPNQEGLFGERDSPEAAGFFEGAVREAQEDAKTRSGASEQSALFKNQGVPPEPPTRGGGAVANPPVEGAGQPGQQGGGGLFEANQPAEGAGGAGSGPLGFGRRGVLSTPPLPKTEPELRDVQKQMTPGLGSKHGEVVDGLLSALLPSAISPEHLGEAELLGTRIGEMNRRAESSEVARKPWITKFYKAGVDRADIELKDNPGVQFMSAVSTGKPVDPKFEAYAKLRRILYDGRLRLLEQAGVQFQQLREDYFPGIWLRESRIAFNAALQDAISEGVIQQDANLNRTTPEQRAWVKARADAYYEQGTGSDRDMLSYISRRPLAGKESFLKEKVFDEDILTAMEFGLRPTSYNPAELDGLKLTEMDRSIMAHQHYGDLDAKGQQQIISPYEQVPAGWVKSKDKYGTIYGAPTIELTEHIDKAVYQGLLDVANKLGISHERVASLKGGNLGLSYQGENRIQTKFATETSVMAHEIGHQLDAKYDLWNNLLRTQPRSGEPGKGFRPGRSELRDIADLTERGAVARSKDEKIAQVLEAYIHSPERMQEVAPRVYKWFDNFVKTTPELAPLAEIKPGIALQKLTTEKYVGLPILGYRIVPEPVADVLNNYLSSSLYNSRALGKPYKAWMWFASLLNQAQLGMGSAFHASFTSFDVQMRAQSNVIKDIYGLLRGNRTPSDVANSTGKAAIAIGRTPTVGDQVLNAWRYPDRPVDPKIAQVTRALALAQAGFKIERGLKLEETEKVSRDWYSDRKIQAALRSPFAAVELMSKPIMEWIVPREKAGAFADMAWRIIERNPGKSLEELTPDFRKAWNRIDGTLGQVRYDRVFMNNMLKNFFQGIIRAPGWTGGTIVELGGAFKDIGSFMHEWVKTGKPPQEMPDRVAYGISLLLTSAIVNGALTWAFTGQRPRGMDFFAFRDGNKDKDGNQTRMLIPSYMKDILAYYEEGIPSALVSKAHPAIALANDVLWRNQDYFGQEIRNPEDPYLPHGLSAKDITNSQIYEGGKYVLKAFIPFWLRGVQRQQEQGAGIGRQAASYFGVMPAPGYLIQDEPTKALNKMIQDKLPAVRTPPTERQEAMKEIIQGRRGGEDTATDLLAARQEGLVNKRDVQRIGEQGRITPMQAKMEGVYRDYGVTGLLTWYEKYQSVMDDEDKADAQKVLRKARLSMAQNPQGVRGTAAERQSLIQRLNSALGLRTVPPQPTSSTAIPAPQ